MAWSDVVRAVSQVQFFHATVYEDRPDKTERLDFYYRHPNTWRFQGLGRVTFLTPRGAGVYDVAKHGWALRCDKLDLCLGKDCPPGEKSQMETFSAMLDKGNMLDAVLAAIPIFNGKPPAGEPVKSDQAIASTGIEAFDYAHDADQQWVRIWVLKKSRLPIQMVVYQPDQNESMLVVFDYTTARSEEFFDLGKFEKAVQQKPRATPEEIYREGARGTGRKPIDSQQAFELKGGYKAPVLTAIESAGSGDLLITAENPRNRNPQGGHVPGSYFQQLFDNWGNTYWRISADDYRDEKLLRQVYLAVPPLRTGEGPHTIALRYCVWGNDEGVNMNYDKIQSEVTVDVPQPAAKGIPENWPDAKVLRDPLERAHALYRFHFARSPLRMQLGTVDPLLAKKPNDIDVLYEKLDILRFYELDEDRFWLFERTLKDRALANPFGNWRLSNILGDYLIHLFNAGRRREFDALIKQLEPLKEKFIASTTPDAREMQGSFRRYTTSLPIALAIPQALAAIEKGPRPTVEVLGRSRDGWLWLSVTRPPSGNHNSSDHSWSSPRVPKGSVWTLVSSLGVGDKIFIKAKGAGDELRLDFDVMILPLVIGAGEAVFSNQHFVWPMIVKVPTASVETARELAPYRPKWLPGGAPGIDASGATPPLDLAWAEASRLFDVGQYTAALAIYRDLLSWPSENKSSAKATKMVSDETRRSIRAREISCLLRLDRLDEARVAADRLDAESPKPDFANPDSLLAGMDARSARVEIVDWLIAHKRLDEAQKTLDQLDRGRPDPRLLDSRNIATKVSYGMRGWQPTYENWRLWSGVDRAWWRLRQAQTGQRIPLVETCN